MLTRLLTVLLRVIFRRPFESKKSELLCRIPHARRDLATNATIREIAEQSYLSPNTVKTQIKSLYRKLGVNSRAAAVTTAHSWNLV